MKAVTNTRMTHTQCSLAWSLKLGSYLGTLSTAKAIRLAEVRPYLFQRWINGKQEAPAGTLAKLKSHALALPEHPLRKSAKPALLHTEDMQASHEWKTLLFDRLSITGKRRFCNRLKRLHR